ncbi:hypothetical protein TYRP_004148 [Tyrophagus putrescentiae]|nr:hypothetical protein TYRP_004148 [Tyrophagus putrescentiae]
MIVHCNEMEKENRALKNKPQINETSLLCNPPDPEREAEEAQDEAGRPLGELAGQPALQCYQCNSLEDGKACSGSKEVLLANAAKFLKGCPPLPKNNGSSVMVVAAVGCWKLSQKVDYSQGPGLSAHYRVIRRCAYLGQEEASCASRTGYGTSTTQCFCSSQPLQWSTGSVLRLPVHHKLQQKDHLPLLSMGQGCSNSLTNEERLATAAAAVKGNKNNSRPKGRTKTNTAKTKSSKGKRKSGQQLQQGKVKAAPKLKADGKNKSKGQNRLEKKPPAGAQKLAKSGGKGQREKAKADTAKAPKAKAVKSKPSRSHQRQQLLLFLNSPNPHHPQVSRCPVSYEKAKTRRFSVGQELPKDLSKLGKLIRPKSVASTSSRSSQRSARSVGKWTAIEDEGEDEEEKEREGKTTARRPSAALKEEKKMVVKEDQTKGGGYCALLKREDPQDELT